MTDVEPGAKGKFDINGFILQLETPPPGHVNKDGIVNKSDEPRVVANKLSVVNLWQAKLKREEGGLRRAFLALRNKYPDQEALMVEHIENKAKEDEDYKDLLGLFNKE